jgi:hypothetical protein
METGREFDLSTECPLSTLNLKNLPLMRYYSIFVGIPRRVIIRDTTNHGTSADHGPEIRALISRKMSVTRPAHARG